LKAIRRHSVSANPYEAPGEQDITAHVNFSALIDTGDRVGLETVGLTSQEKFLLALGELNQFSDLYDSGQTEVEMLNARMKLKRLISPEGMGNIFKVLIQRRGISGGTVAGLRFERKR